MDPIPSTLDTKSVVYALSKIANVKLTYRKDRSFTQVLIGEDPPIHLGWLLDDDIKSLKEVHEITIETE